MLAYKLMTSHKNPDKERSEKKLTIDNFLESYNENLPSGFPQASISTLKEFRKSYPGLFKNNAVWTLGVHRKKVMDWLPQHNRFSN